MERKINVVTKLRRPDVNHPRVWMIDGDRKHGDRGERRRCCQTERRTNCAEVVAARSVIVVSRTAGLGL